MKKAIVLTLVLCCGVLLSGCTKDNTNDDNNSQVEETRKLELKVTVPEGWEKNEDSVLDVQYQKGTASFIVKVEPFGTTDLDEVITKAKEIFEDSFDNVKFIGDVKDRKISGFDAKEFEFTTTIYGLDMRYKYAYTVVNNEIYAITLADLDSTFANNSADFDAILKGIKFE